jgi:hypothetical protein
VILERPAVKCTLTGSLVFDALTTTARAGHTVSMAWTQAATALVGISGGLLAAVGAATTYGTNRRAQYDRVLAETAKLTTGDIADSRHRVALVMEHPAQEGPCLDEKQVEDFYNVLWMFERLDALFASLQPIIPRGRFTRPQRLLLVSVNSAAANWMVYVENLPGPITDVSKSSAGLRHLHSQTMELTDTPSLGSWRRSRAGVNGGGSVPS